jgi:hypothetical protein
MACYRRAGRACRRGVPRPIRARAPSSSADVASLALGRGHPAFGQAVACGDNGIASFDRIRYRRHDGGVFLYAFDLIESDGADLRRDPLAVRKATLASLLARAAPGLRFNEYLETARSYSITPASSGLRASFRNGRTRATVRDSRRIGSKSTTRTHQQRSERPKRTGADGRPQKRDL